MDTDAIRRAWPNVLGRIFTMRRITWTFVSQNAQVTAFDGKKLTLGIATAGLTQTFRAGNHADIVRQALIDELGVDAIVDGIHVDAVSQQAPVAPPPGVGSARAPRPAEQGCSWRPGRAGSPPDSPEASRVMAAQAASRGVMPARGMSPPSPDSSSSGRGRRIRWIVPRPSAGGGASTTGSRGATALADAGLSPGLRPPLEDNAGWGSATEPAPGLGHGSRRRSRRPRVAVGQRAGCCGTHGLQWRVAPAGGDVPTHSAVRGASAVRQSFAQARSRAGGSPSRRRRPAATAGHRRLRRER